MSDAIVTITDANFEDEVLKSALPVIVDFWAVWCVPCKMIAPTVDQIAVEYKDKLKVGKLDVDSNRAVRPNTASGASRRSCCSRTASSRRRSSGPCPRTRSSPRSASTCNGHGRDAATSSSSAPGRPVSPPRSTRGARA